MYIYVIDDLNKLLMKLLHIHVSLLIGTMKILV